MQSIQKVLSEWPNAQAKIDPYYSLTYGVLQSLLHTLLFLPKSLCTGAFCPLCNLLSSICASHVQTDRNASKPQRRHSGYTQFTKRDHQVPSYLSSTYDALSDLHSVLSSQHPLQVCSPFQGHDLSQSNTEAGSFKGGPISRGKIPKLTLATQP